MHINDQRILWQDPSPYLRMMPFSYADAIREPRLLIHGTADKQHRHLPHAVGAHVRGGVVARMIAWYNRYGKEGAPGPVVS